MRILKAFASTTTMLLHKDNLLLDWVHGRFTSQRIRFHQPILDVTPTHAATRTSTVDLYTLMPSFYKNTWANSRSHAVFLGRDDVARTSTYNPHLQLHELNTPERMLSDAMPIHMDANLSVLCSHEAIVNGTRVDTRSTPTCGDTMGTTAAIGTLEGRILVYEGSTLRTIYSCENRSPITSLRMASSSRLIASGHADGTILMHTLSPRTFAVRQVGIKTYHTGSAVRRIRMDSKRMASSDDTGSIHIASTIGNKVWWSRTGHAFDLNSYRLVIADRDAVDVLRFN